MPPLRGTRATRPHAWISLFLVLAALLAAPARARAADEVTASAVAQVTRVYAGGQFAIAVVLDMKEGWHVWPAKGVGPPVVGGADIIPTSVDLPRGAPLPSGVRVAVGAIQWPAPILAQVPGTSERALVYGGRAVAYVPVILPANLSPGPLTIALDVRYQACNAEVCLRDESPTVEAQFTIVPPDQAQEVSDATLFSDFNPAVFARLLSGEVSDRAGVSAPIDFLGYTFEVSGYLPIFLVAFAAGVLMNFTPCVLPVIPIKIMSLQAQAKHRARLLALGAAYCTGIVALFVVLSILVLFVRLNFGQWFSFWWVAVPLALFVCVMALTMLGLFSLRLPAWVYSIDGSHETVASNLKMGFLTGVLSTPCTGPMFGAALAWASRQPPLVGMAAIITMGLGMALPYLLLVIFPNLIGRMPRSGPGAELLKHVLGLFMLAVAAYIALSWIGATWMWYIVGGLAVVACLWWMIGSWRHLRRTGPRLFSTAAAGLCMLFSAWVGLALAKGSAWPVLPVQTDATIRAAIDDSVRAGQTIVVDFTANWCVNCLAIERTVLNTDAADELFARFRARRLKVDLSRPGDERGWGLVREVLGGAGSIPLIAIYGPGTGPAKPVFFASFFKIADLEHALAKASGQSPSAPAPPGP